MKRTLILSAASTALFAAAALLAGPSASLAGQGKAHVQDLSAAPGAATAYVGSANGGVWKTTNGAAADPLAGLTGAPAAANGLTKAGAGTLVLPGAASAAQGGVNVAAGDLNGDGRADVITGAAPQANAPAGFAAPQGPAQPLLLPAIQKVREAASRSTGTTTVNGGVLQAQGPAAPSSPATGPGTIAAPGAQPAGLLLPAVQKARDAASR